jgi:hypothetical protein
MAQANRRRDMERCPLLLKALERRLGPLQTALDLFDSGVTELYPHAHGCLLLWRCLVRVRERYTRGSQPQLPNVFSEERWFPG